MTGAANRSHRRRWVSACLRDHRWCARCRSGSRYQAIRSAPGRSMSGAPAASRSVTLASLAASSASVMACRNRRRPFSVNAARHGAPASSGGYTTIPHPASTTTRPGSRADSRASPVTRLEPRVLRAAFRVRGAVGGTRFGASCVRSVLILVFAGAARTIAKALFLRNAQVRGLTDHPGSCGQGRGRTADLPLFRRTLVPTELPDLAGAAGG